MGNVFTWLPERQNWPIYSAKPPFFSFFFRPFPSPARLPFDIMDPLDRVFDFLSEIHGDDAIDKIQGIFEDPPSKERLLSLLPKDWNGVCIAPLA